VNTKSHTLLLEDDDNDFFLFERAWKKCSDSRLLHRVSNGKQALDWLALAQVPGPRPSTLPRLIISDIRMPMVTGFEFLENLNLTSRIKDLVVVMWSSSNELEDVNRAYRLGARSYIQKPNTAAEMENAVRRVHDYWFSMCCLPHVGHL
jgi:chemotaxis family two-component system response regulator Rcp1